MRYTPEQRERIIVESIGKVIQSLEWSEEHECWIMTFTDGSETAFRFMAEMQNDPR